MIPAAAPAPPAPPLRSGGEFAELARTVRDAGLLRRRLGYYAVTCGLTVAVFAATWVVFGVLGDSWWQLVTAAFLAVVSTHLGFLGHDAGHKQIFGSRRANDAVGLAFAGLLGLSYGWWNGKHNRHHRNPNDEHGDPDLDIVVLAFTHEQGRSKRGFLRWMAKHQAVLFVPLLLTEGMNLHWASVQAVWRGEMKDRALEKALLIAHFSGYLTAVLLVLPWPKAVLFVVVHQCLWGLYMGCAFAPNHKGMPSLGDIAATDFLRKQVLTSRNVRGRWAGFALGGLSHQIEHHLFPSMPRPNLRHAQPIVRAFCAEHDIRYSECGLLQSYGLVLRHLHAVGAPLRAAPR